LTLSRSNFKLLRSWISPINGLRLLCGAGVVTVLILLLMAKKPWEILAEIGAPEKPRDFVGIYFWWAGAINALLLTGLGLTVPWWLRAGAPSPVRRWLPARPRGRVFFLLVLAAMGLSAFFGWQRLDFSLWDDEDNSLRRVILGRYSRGAERQDDTPKLKERSWNDALWNYTRPSNHVLQTLLSRVSLSAWRAAAQPKGLQFKESALRFPGYLAAILSVGAIAILLRRLGFARAGVMAAFLLALHPWQIRYAAEARGYIFTLLFGPLMLYCLLMAMEKGRWRWWFGFAASEFLLLYAYPGCLYMLVLANVCGLLALTFRLDGFSERLVHIPRMLVASSLAGMLYLQLMLPNLPQLTRYLSTERALGVLDARWHRNMLAHLATGIPWNNSDDPASGYPELLWMIETRPWLQIALLVIPGFLLLAGVLRLLASRPAGWLVVAVLLLPALAVYVVSRSNNNYLYEWYVIFVLPGLVASVALGAEWPMRLLDRWRWGHRIAIPILMCAVLMGYAVASQPARKWMLTHPLQLSKDSILAVRPSLDPYDPRQKDLITVSLGMHLESYDPNILSAQDVANLTRIAQEADALNKPLYVITGNDLAVSLDYPDLRTFIRNPAYFDAVSVLPGYDPTLTHYLWRYRPGTLAPHEN
jgi:hypothetical protein